MASAAPPKQLSPAILSCLLEDLSEFNGLNYRPVPLRTFREKYIGLYFGSVEDETCVSFCDRLKAFYTVNNHKFEIVLVSCDADQDSYTRHTHKTMWPSYPCGDYRILLLRNFFEIDECPRLIIIDPNGIVVTSDGVAKLRADQNGVQFPWCDRVVQMLYGERVQGRLRTVLEDMGLPAFGGVPATDREVVGLLFGDLWDPEARDLLSRVQYLVQQFSKRPVAWGEMPHAERVCFYFIHQEDLEKYHGFPVSCIPFPTLQLTNEERRQALNSFLGIKEHPALVLCSPKRGWVVHASEWLRQDPTGICFPWQRPGEFDPGLDGEDMVSQSIIQPLAEDDLNTALCQGPVFVALLHNVRAQRSEALATLRAAAKTFSEMGPAQKSSLVAEPRRGSIEDLRQRMSLPRFSVRSPDRHGRGAKTHDEPGPRVLWRGLQKAIGASIYGSAPWNLTGHADRNHGAAQLSFFFSIAEDRSTQMLSKFCCYDVHDLHQHQLWLRERAKQDSETFQMHGEVAQRLSRLTDMVQTMKQIGSDGEKQNPGLGKVFSSTFPSSPMGGMIGMDSVSTDTGGMPSIDSEPSALESTASMPALEKEVNGQRFQPSVRYNSLQEQTEDLLGDGSAGHGSALILDMTKGIYHLCGSLTDESSILRFLDGWHQGILDPFEIGMLNHEELLQNDDEEVQRQIASRAAGSTSDQWTDHLPGAMPGVVIWIPTKEHSDLDRSPGSMYRALLNYAYRRCPRQDNSALVPPNGAFFTEEDREGLPPASLESLSPWIERLWVLGLEDCDEARAEKGAGDWKPPDSEFLANLRDLVTTVVSSDQSFYDETRDVLISHTTTFDEGLQVLRQRAEGHSSRTIAGNLSVCMRTARTRRELYRMMLDELSYHAIVQYPPPPLFVLFAGDLPPADTIPWPSFLRLAHMEVVGSVPGGGDFYRDICCPDLNHTSFSQWRSNSFDDNITASAAKHLDVPFV